MSDRSPTLLVLRARETHRIHEALRAALGLTLRGRSVRIYCEPPVTKAELPPADQRQVSTLEALGVELLPIRELGTAQLRTAHAVEVWS